MSYYCVFKTRMGFVALAGSGDMLLASTLPRSTREEALSAAKAGLPEPLVEDVAAFGDLPSRLMSYFEGKPTDFSDVNLDLASYGPFHAAVISAAQKVPYGRLVTYGDLATMAGSPGAARAAGTAMARNRFPIIVPCHRVVAAGGKIGGFASGLEWKRDLLRIEGVDVW